MLRSFYSCCRSPAAYVSPYNSRCITIVASELEVQKRLLQPAPKVEPTNLSGYNQRGPAPSSSCDAMDILNHYRRKFKKDFEFESVPYSACASEPGLQAQAPLLLWARWAGGHCRVDGPSRIKPKSSGISHDDSDCPGHGHGPSRPGRAIGRFKICQNRHQQAAVTNSVSPRANWAVQSMPIINMESSKLLSSPHCRLPQRDKKNCITVT